MAIRKSAQTLQRYPAQSADSANDTYTLVSEYAIEATLAANDLIEMSVLPHDFILAGPPIVVCEDLDTGIGLTLDCGLFTGEYLAALDLSGAARVCGTEFFLATNVGQAGGVATSTSAAALLLRPSLYDRSMGFKVVTAAGGNVAGAKLRLIVPIVPAPNGI